MLGLDPIAQGDEVRRRTGVLTENAGLDDRFTTRENLRLHRAAPRLLATRREHARRRVARTLRHGRSRRRPHPGLLDRATQARGARTSAAARPGAAVPRRADLGPRPRRHARRDRFDPRARRRRPHDRVRHSLPRRGRPAGHPMAVLHRGQLRAYGDPDELAARVLPRHRCRPRSRSAGVGRDGRTTRGARRVCSAVEAAPTGARLARARSRGRADDRRHARRPRDTRVRRVGGRADLGGRLLRDRDAGSSRRPATTR